MERRQRIALLIDADNAPAKKIDLILNELSSLGETNIRRAYGNLSRPNLQPWVNVLHEHAIRPMQQYDLSKGKNASDLALAVDAVSLHFTDEPDVFGIVSSDADFTPLVMFLRERGAVVIGFGEAKTPKPFVTACSRFLYLEQLLSESEKVSTAVEGDSVSSSRLRIPTKKLRADTSLVALLRNAVASTADDSGWAKASAINGHIRNQSSMDHRNFGYARFTDFLRATELFESRDDGTPTVAFRDARNVNGATGSVAKRPATKKS